MNTSTSYAERFKRAILRGVKDFMEDVLKDASEMAPKKTGRLSKSGVITEKEDSIELMFNTEYAAAVEFGNSSGKRRSSTISTNTSLKNENSASTIRSSANMSGLFGLRTTGKGALYLSRAITKNEVSLLSYIQARLRQEFN